MHDPDALDEAVRQLTRDLPYCEDEDVLADCRERAASMAAEIDLERGTPREVTNRGRWSDDPHNALLAVYDTPRTAETAGPLSGTTVAIKDHIAVAGLPMTAGLGEASFVPGYDAALVERLLAAGAGIVGKANMDALAIGPEGVWSERGQVRNSIASDRVPGGSSSGSAVAVATGLADGAIGSDAGGSIRKPAAYNDLVGVKPTQGAVPSHGKVMTQTTLGATGPIAATVEEATAILDVIAGPDRRDPGSRAVDLGQARTALDEPEPWVVGVPDSFLESADRPVADRIDSLADELAERTPCTLRSISLDNGVSRLPGYLSGPEFRWLLEQEGVNHGPGVAGDRGWSALLAALRRQGLNEHVTRRKLAGAILDEATGGRSYVAAWEEMVSFQERFDECFETVDLLLTPTVPALPPPLDADIENLPRNLSINCQPFNLAGAPAVSVPAGRAEGLPVGAQIAAPVGADARALRGARLVERLAA